MTAKVTLSFSDETIADARHWAKREGVSLSAWIDRATRERTLREVFNAHAAAVRRAGIDCVTTALADEQEHVQVETELYNGPSCATR
jgi:hypothetical protein